jgi:hypothetical protein
MRSDCTMARDASDVPVASTSADCSEELAADSFRPSAPLTVEPFFADVSVIGSRATYRRNLRPLRAGLGRVPLSTKHLLHIWFRRAHGQTGCYQLMAKKLPVALHLVRWDPTPCGYSHLPVCGSNAVSAALPRRSVHKVAVAGACGVTEVALEPMKSLAWRPGAACAWNRRRKVLDTEGGLHIRVLHVPIR